MVDKHTQPPTKFCMKCGASVAGTYDRCPTDGFRLVSSSSDNLLGSTIEDRYTVDSVIGTGGWATIYQAQDKSLRRRVAIKVLHTVHLVDDHRIARFMREAQAVAQLQHRNICLIYDFGFLRQGQPYIVMEYLEGMTLSKALYEKGALPAAPAIDKAIQACDALAHAHKKGIVHRDIKPGNIMLLNEDRVKLLDFGLAKMTFDKEERSLTASGVTVGTAEYMSPEQCHGLPVSPATDIYALGCVLFEMLTGSTPFEADSDFSYMSKHANERAPTLQSRCPDRVFSAKLESVIAKALEKLPAKRYDDAYAFKHELSAALREIDSPKVSPFKMPAQVRNIALWLGVLALIVAAAVAFFYGPHAARYYQSGSPMR